MSLRRNFPNSSAASQFDENFCTTNISHWQRSVAAKKENVHLLQQCEVDLRTLQSHPLSSSPGYEGCGAGGGHGRWRG